MKSQEEKNAIALLLERRVINTLAAVEAAYALGLRDAPSDTELNQQRQMQAMAKQGQR